MSLLRFLRSSKSKLLSVLSLIFVFTVFLGLVSSSHVAQAVGQSQNQSCFDSTSNDYDTPECVRKRLGLDQVKFPFLGYFDVDSISSLIFNLFLTLANVASVLMVILGGVKIAMAKDNDEERKKGVNIIKWALIALIIINLSFSIASSLLYVITGNEIKDRVINCDDLPESASESLKERCNKLKNRSR